LYYTDHLIQISEIYLTLSEPTPYCKTALDQHRRPPTKSSRCLPRPHSQHVTIGCLLKLAILPSPYITQREPVLLILYSKTKYIVISNWLILHYTCHLMQLSDIYLTLSEPRPYCKTALDQHCRLPTKSSRCLPRPHSQHVTIGCFLKLAILPSPYITQR
jgi:hypothetical protein